MPIRVTTVAHGAAALDALAAAVRSAKGGDALAPVVVVVPTNTAGVMARRALGRRGGAAAIDVVTLFRVAELLGAPSLVDGGRKPVSTPVVDLAVKQLLRQSPGLYRDVAEHPSTVVALRDLYREVRMAGRGASTALGRTPRGGEPARVVAELARRLAAGWYDEGDLLERAAQQARMDLPPRFGRVVVHLPERLRPLQMELLRALGEAADVQLLVALTGDDDADRDAVELTCALTAADPAPLPETMHGRPPGGDVDVVSTTDADDEVRIAVRAVLDAARSGTPFDRMALVWPTDRPYARIVEHHLGAAGLPWNGRPGTAMAERAVPRVLAELLQLDRRGLRRSNLTALLGDVPAQMHGRIVPTARWERIGRDAGVLREQHWDTHLPRWIDRARERRPFEIADAEALHEFVTELRGALGPPSAARTWSDWADWAKQQLDRWFGYRLDRLQGEERSAWEDTQRVLDRLGHLDTISEPVDRAEFRATFVAELDIAPARHGTVGDGIHVGTVAGARGLDVDLVVVLGAADGLLPPPPTVDPLLGDHERRLAGLVTSEERVRIAHRQFLALTATTPNVVVIVPRGDLRATAAHHPSRWLAPLLHQAGRQMRHVDSHAHGVASTEFPISAAEHRVRDLWVHVSAGAPLGEHPRVRADPILAGALRMRKARASDRLTEFDGDLSSQSIPAFAGPISPSQLEAWRACPHAYFVRYLLGVRPVQEPDEITVLDPLDRGTAIHDAVDRLQRRALAGELPDPGTTGWTDAHAAALHVIAAQVADDLEATGRSGRVAYWVTERAKILRELSQWLDIDTEQWAGRRLLASEQRFGDDEAVDLALPGGRRIAFKGTIDRIDELTDGTLLVTDHKTGKADPFKQFSADPTLGGTHFQLPVYAVAARVVRDRADAPVAAEYSFFAKAGFRRLRATLDDAVWSEVAVALGDVVAGIEAGVFPLVPEPPKYRLYPACQYCEPDGLGTAPQWAEWTAKRNDGRLARWFEFGDSPRPDRLRTHAEVTS